MIGIGDHEYVAIRFEAFADEVLGPRVHAQRAPLELAVFQTPTPVSLDDAMRAPYRPVEPGFRWGPVWSTAWFRVRGRVPATMAGQRVALRFSSGTEALLWRDGAPWRGFDDNRDTAVLLDPAGGGEDLELFVEAACNHPLGTSTFFWDPPEHHRRWSDAEPGRVGCCELVTVDERFWRLRHTLHFVRQLALALPPESARAHRLVRGLRQLLASAPADDPDALLALGPALDALRRGDRAPAATRCTAVGHAHIDTAWLWPVRETRRKLLRSWSNALELMERSPRFCFVASQAQHYAFVEQDAPALFARIRARVAEGRWEAGGAMWVEPDCNAPSGESLVRQIVHGTRWWEDRFGERGRQRHLYLPDTFGFPASLPQIAKLGGLDTFVTNKLVWSERDEFPHTTFLWRGIDGTELLTHFTPGDDYNAQLAPQELVRGEGKLIRKDLREVMQSRSTVTRWLQPFGFGDGGGGPTPEQALRAELAADAEGLPQVEPGTLTAFCDALHAERAAARGREGRDLPVWDGELYLEKHRGTLTSVAWLKAANARAERRLRVVEALLAGAGDAALRAAWQPRVAACWRTLLLHQFHDILPGSSIAAVYDDARAAFAELDAELDRALRAGLDALAARLGRGDAARPVLVFNPCSHPRAGIVEVDGALLPVASVPALGAVVVDAAHPRRTEELVEVSTTELHNGRVSVFLDAAGRIARLSGWCSDGAVNASDAGGGSAPLNQLVVHEDRPRRWEAWDVDFDVADRTARLDGPADAIRVLESGPLRGVVEVVRTFRRSRIVQRYVLTAGSRHVEVHNEIDWREDRAFLRALFPTRIRARRATFGIQFGHVERPTHRNTSWDEARFEVPGHRWMDLSQPGLGLAVLDDGKYGRSADGGTLGLSLLRAPSWPAPGVDHGVHRFCYALLPHDGDLRTARVPAVADEVAEGWITAPLPAAAPSGPDTWQPFVLEPRDPGSVEVACWKPAEDQSGDLVLRLVERRGGWQPLTVHWRTKVRQVLFTDLLERPLPGRSVGRAPAIASTDLALGPFEIVTLRVTETAE